MKRPGFPSRDSTVKRVWRSLWNFPGRLFTLFLLLLAVALSVDVGCWPQRWKMPDCALGRKARTTCALHKSTLFGHAGFLMKITFGLSPWWPPRSRYGIILLDSGRRSRCPPLYDGLLVSLSRARKNGCSSKASVQPWSKPWRNRFNFVKFDEAALERSRWSNLLRSCLGSPAASGVG